MRIGIVSKWIASGQAIVARHLRSGLLGLGHEVEVLARPGSGPRAERAGGAADRHDSVWAIDGLTEASTHEIPAAEYLDWACGNRLDAIFFDENRQFDEIAALRAEGIRTIGRFVWEYFEAGDVAGTLAAYDTVYTLTRAERQRYAELGVEGVPVRWGVHPELLGVEGERDPELIRFYFPGSFLGRRKPLRKIVKAFRRADGGHIRLVISAQVPDRNEFLEQAAAKDPRVELALDDEPEAEHRRRFASCDVCLTPTRWEGLGLPLFEATAFGLPIITNDKPPMSEMVLDGESGILVSSTQNGTARSGIPAWDPDPDELTAAIERLGDRAELERMQAGVAKLREQRRWELTLDDLAALLAD